ncbi:unnamed protein product [Protopolystoma xenopodis]|uniref:Uncharacterized protein n=1 Tax=Protopolystoma xenopodis TaxID=117903 RepID=A0A3S5CNJ3_9PLAT|nr:unnamed protein product [Protopolystoma xenopodis]
MLEYVADPFTCEQGLRLFHCKEEPALASTHADDKADGPVCGTKGADEASALLWRPRQNPVLGKALADLSVKLC